MVLDDKHEYKVHILMILMYVAEELQEIVDVITKSIDREMNWQYFAD